MSKVTSTRLGRAVIRGARVAFYGGLSGGVVALLNEIAVASPSNQEEVTFMAILTVILTGIDKWIRDRN